jgi:phosphatidylserine/phosphatidylglycerophosphate/cardiolipin synthase-like enzyme
MRSRALAAATAGFLLVGVAAGGALGRSSALARSADGTPVIVIGPALPTPRTASTSPTPQPDPTATPSPTATPTVPPPPPPVTSPSPPVPGSAQDTFVPVSGATFGDPTAPSNDILDRLMENIAHTPRGATIQIVGYSFSLTRVSTALLKAYDRGVNVQVVMDGHSSQWAPAARMVPVLGSDPGKPSFFVLTHGSARGTGGVTHEKAWTFSRVGQTPYVVMIGSTNLTGYGTGVQFSDNYSYTGRKDVYDAYASMFALQKLDQPVTNPFATKTFDHGSAYFFPMPGATVATDPVVSRINALPSDSSTNIVVSQYAWWDTRGTWIARALAAKKRAGATVTVLAGESVSAPVRDTLRAAGIPISSGVYADGKRIHTKLMLADYQDASGRHRSIWTGSDNWANQSFRNDDTVLQVIDDRVAYDAYVAFVNQLIAR